LQKDDGLVSAQLFTSGMEPKKPPVLLNRTFILSDYLYYARRGDILKLTVNRGGLFIDGSFTGGELITSDITISAGKRVTI
jgi:hypothetical protein